MKTQQFLRIITPTLILIVVSLLALVTGCTLLSPATSTNPLTPRLTDTPSSSSLTLQPTASPISLTTPPKITSTLVPPTEVTDAWITHAPENSVVNDLVAEGNYVWTATNGDGVIRWRRSNDSMTHEIFILVLQWVLFLPCWKTVAINSLSVLWPVNFGRWLRQS